MSRRFELSIGVTLGALFLTGCYDLKKEDPGVELVPDAQGLVSVPELGIHGHWYAYGDQYDIPRRCVMLGRHFPEQCSTISSPDHLPSFAKPTDGAMCVSGEVAKAIACLRPQEIECMKPAAHALNRESGDGGASPADAENEAGGSGGARGWDTIPQIHNVTLAEGCTCDDPSCLPNGELCYCPPVMPVACNGNPDYGNIWGAGIGLDFDLPTDDSRDPLDRNVWDPTAHGITGVAFDFALLEGSDDADFVRVEFPIMLPDGLTLPVTATGTNGPDWMGTVSLDDIRKIAPPGQPYPDQPAPSEEHPSGSPFWEASTDWNSQSKAALRRGHNVLHFSEVNPPPFSQIEDASRYAYAWDPTRLLGIQFHVRAIDTKSQKFSFCISNLTLIRD